MGTAFNDAVTKMIDVGGTSFTYREIGQAGGVPLLFLHHLTAGLEDWDPAIIDGLAADRPVVIFDNRGVGGSGGVTPDTAEDMAKDAIAFIEALDLSQVDLLGYSLGGFLAQLIACWRPSLVRRMILAGTSAKGGEGIAGMFGVLQDAFARATAEARHPKHILFFVETLKSQAAADDFLARLALRSNDKDKPISNETIQAQAAAINKWGLATPESLEDILQPTFVVNGDRDVMAPTVNSFDLARRLPNAQLSIFPNSGHGAIFEYHEQFVAQARRFLRD